MIKKKKIKRRFKREEKEFQINIKTNYEIDHLYNQTNQLSTSEIKDAELICRHYFLVDKWKLKECLSLLPPFLHHFSVISFLSSILSIKKNFQISNFQILQSHFYLHFFEDIYKQFSTSSNDFLAFCYLIAKQKKILFTNSSKIYLDANFFEYKGKQQWEFKDKFFTIFCRVFISKKNNFFYLRKFTESKTILSFVFLCWFFPVFSVDKKILFCQLIEQKNYFNQLFFDHFRFLSFKLINYSNFLDHILVMIFLNDVNEFTNFSMIDQPKNQNINQNNDQNNNENNDEKTRSRSNFDFVSIAEKMIKIIFQLIKRFDDENLKLIGKEFEEKSINFFSSFSQFSFFLSLITNTIK